MYIHYNGSRRFVTLPKYEYKFVGVSVTSCEMECDATFKIRNILGMHMMLEHMTDIYLNV